MIEDTATSPTEEKLITLIAHLVYSGLEVERALELAREYATGMIATFTFAGMIISPKLAEKAKSDAREKAAQMVLEAVPNAWALCEQWRLIEVTTHYTPYTKEDVKRILAPYVREL